MSSNFSEQVFRHKVDNCLSLATQLLDRTKHLTTPDKVAHRYEDKYLVAEYLVNAAIVSYLNCLGKLGVSEQQLVVLEDWASNQTVTLLFTMTRECEFVREITREEEDSTKTRTEVAGLFSIPSMFTSKVIRTITEYEYKYSATYELVAYRGVNDVTNTADRMMLLTRSSEMNIVRSVQALPYPEKALKEFDVDISWLLRTKAAFFIDRAQKDCHTPSQNNDVWFAQDFFAIRFQHWVSRVTYFIRYEYFKVEQEHSTHPTRLNLNAINTDGILVPVVPLVMNFEADVETDGERSGDDNDAFMNEEAAVTSADSPSSSPNAVTTITDSSPVTLTASIVAQLLNEQSRSLDAKCTTVIDALFPNPSESTALITASEARLLMILLHMGDVAEHLQQGIKYIEDLIRKQLISAIGKELKATDFGDYMQFHYRKLLREEFHPQPFSHAIRRSDRHSPEGSIRIESNDNGSVYSPVYTFSECVGDFPMQMALSSSTLVTFGGDRMVHGLIVHRFSGGNNNAGKLRLTAQARQFSGFMVFVGRIASATLFEPKYGMIVQNKDEIQIPLCLETFPTPKAFRDAIESLSPEQQRFAKAYRAMQLESTLFGILVIQIKPQLEKVLNLSSDMLTKEIKLTQQLTELFIKYQIPSDLLSYDTQRVVEQSSSSSGSSGAVVSSRSGGSVRLNSVKDNVKAMGDMIKAAKEEELERRLQEARRAAAVKAAQEAAQAAKEAVERERQAIDEVITRRSAVRDMERLNESIMMRPGGARHNRVQSQIDDVKDVMIRNIDSVLQRGEMMESLEVRAEELQQSAGVFKRNAASLKSKSFAGRLGSIGSAISSVATAPIKALGGNSSSAERGSMMRLEAVDASRSADAAINATSEEGKRATSSQTTQAGKKSLVKRVDIDKSNTASKSSLQAIDCETVPHIDLTQIPGKLDQKYEALDTDAALKPTTINPSSEWTKRSQKSLLAEPTETLLHAKELEIERSAAFDLLDALSKSGGLTIDCAELHVVIAATHCFDKSVMDTIVNGNVNPIERVERSALIMASTLHQVDAEEMIVSSQLARVQELDPQLFA
jgi:hypothetical protein